MAFRSLTGAALALARDSNAVSAQVSHEVEWRAVCAECRLSIDPIFRLSSEAETRQAPDRALLYDSFVAAMDPSTGHILAVLPVEYAAMSAAQVGSSFMAMEGLDDLFPGLVVLRISMDR